MMNSETFLNELIGLVAELKSLAETAKKLDKPDIAEHLDGARILVVRATEQMEPNEWRWKP